MLLPCILVHLYLVDLDVFMYVVGVCFSCFVLSCMLTVRFAYSVFIYIDFSINRVHFCLQFCFVENLSSQ